MQDSYWLIFILIIVLVLIGILLYFNSKNSKSDKKLRFNYKFVQYILKWYGMVLVY